MSIMDTLTRAAAESTNNTAFQQRVLAQLVAQQQNDAEQRAQGGSSCFVGNKRTREASGSGESSSSAVNETEETTAPVPGKAKQTCRRLSNILDNIRNGARSSTKSGTKNDGAKIKLTIKYHRWDMERQMYKAIQPREQGGPRDILYFPRALG